MGVKALERSDGVSEIWSGEHGKGSLRRFNVTSLSPRDCEAGSRSGFLSARLYIASDEPSNRARYVL
jgi:hypothetical protein